MSTLPSDHTTDTNVISPPTTPQPSPSATQLDAVRDAVRGLLKQPAYDDGSAGPVLVRLAWHSAGTYDAATNTGGSNGAGMRYEKEGGDPANAGLQHARAFLEPIKRQFPWITYADLWTLAAVVAIEEMGGPTISWQGGRTDFTDDTKIPPRGRLPHGSKGPDHLRWIFHRMGFSDQEIVALSGAHNLGRCHMDRSGFEGKWVNNPTRFSNQYYKLLKANAWTPKTLANGVRQFVYVDEDDAAAARENGEPEDEGLAMLPTDMALLDDPVFRVWVDRYAADKDLFFDHFAAVFAKLLELGIQRHSRTGEVVNPENQRAGYRSAPKKSDLPAAPKVDQSPEQIAHEAGPLKEQNRRQWAKL